MSLRYEITQTRTGDLVQDVTHGQLRLAGTAGGPPWQINRRAGLFAHLEQGWPTLPLLVWSPTRTRHERLHLLEGHRPVSALMSVLDDETDLLRDLTTTNPTYVPAIHARTDAWYWPVNAMMLTMRFLRTVQAVDGAMPPTFIERAEHASSRLVHATLTTLTLYGGTPTTVAQLCDQLLPGRVDPTVLATIADGQIR